MIAIPPPRLDLDNVREQPQEAGDKPYSGGQSNKQQLLSLLVLEGRVHPVKTDQGAAATPAPEATMPPETAAAKARIGIIIFVQNVSI